MSVNMSVDMSRFAPLRDEIGAVNDLLCAASLLTWDMRTMMPAGAAETRGRQIATLMTSARERLLGDACRRGLDTARRAVVGLDAADPLAREVAAVEEAIAFHARIPADLLHRKAALRPLATAAWVEARRAGDFALFAPKLAETVALQRDYAAAIGAGEHPYDALIDLYEPGMTLARLQDLFADLRSFQQPLRERAMAQALPPGADFRRRLFPAMRQHAFAEMAGRLFGYEFERGRLDFTLHPFEVSFTRQDVRITMRRTDDFAPPAIFGAMHEIGHALYEQNADPAFNRTALATDLRQFYAVGGTSFGTHESQSRLYENHVGRSEAFWRAVYPETQVLFAPSLDDVRLADFVIAMTEVRPTPIRTDADELTYDAHIMLRVELEAALIDGSLDVADLPGAWAEGMKRGLGIVPAGDAEGCLQDVHWSSGMFGSFCTYTIGNIMAAQLFEAARAIPVVADGLDRADYAPLGTFLREAVWRHARARGRDELLVAATGRELDTGPYLRHLEARYGS